MWNEEDEKEQAEGFRIRAKACGQLYQGTLAKKYLRLAKITEERAKLFHEVNHIHHRIEQARQAFLKRGHFHDGPVQ